MPDKTTPHIEMHPSAEARVIGKANLSVLEHAASNGGDASGFRLDFLTNRHMRDAITEAYRDGYRAALSTTLEPSEAEIEAGLNAPFGDLTGPRSDENGPTRNFVRACLIAAARVRVGEG